MTRPCAAGFLGAMMVALAVAGCAPQLPPKTSAAAIDPVSAAESQFAAIGADIAALDSAAPPREGQRSAPQLIAALRSLIAQTRMIAGTRTDAAEKARALELLTVIEAEEARLMQATYAR